jgi:trimethylguanosine synthase
MKMGSFNGQDLFHLVHTITPNIVYFLPRNTSKRQIRELIPREISCEFEHNFLNEKLKTVTVYFGDLACKPVRSGHTSEPDTD